jgi:hypothetical protein
MKKPTSILTARQQRDYADALADGVPAEVIAEFDASLAKAEERWKRELRNVLRTGRPAILRDSDDGGVEASTSAQRAI